MATVEFYRRNGGLLIAVDDAAAAPRAGDLVNISKKTWVVRAVTWAVDQPTMLKPRLRACVEMDETD